jgi:hypothetical protein
LISTAWASVGANRLGSRPKAIIVKVIVRRVVIFGLSQVHIH